MDLSGGVPLGQCFTPHSKWRENLDVPGLGLTRRDTRRLACRPDHERKRLWPPRRSYSRHPGVAAGELSFRIDRDRRLRFARPSGNVGNRRVGVALVDPIDPKTKIKMR